MKIVFLDAQTMGSDSDLSIFQQFGYLEAYQTTSMQERIEHIGDAKIVLTNKVVIDKEIMDACPNLGLICVTATGMNNIDLDYAKQKGIVVKNVAGYSTASVAQTTIMLVLSLVGRCAYYDTFVKQGGWVKTPTFTHLEKPFWQISSKRWGIVGLGTIGKEVAKIASAFGAEVVYFSASGQTQESHYARVDLETLMRTCDIITIHAPLSEKTRHLIGKNELAMMKDGAVLVNVGRGGIIDEEALAKILDEKELYVGLDVLNQEPMVANHPLLDAKYHDRVIITPHIAWGSIESRTKLMELVAENIKEFLQH